MRYIHPKNKKKFFFLVSGIFLIAGFIILAHPLGLIAETPGSQIQNIASIIYTDPDNSEKTVQSNQVITDILSAVISPSPTETFDPTPTPVEITPTPMPTPVETPPTPTPVPTESITPTPAPTSSIIPIVTPSPTPKPTPKGKAIGFNKKNPTPSPTLYTSTTSPTSAPKEVAGVTDPPARTENYYLRWFVIWGALLASAASLLIYYLKNRKLAEEMAEESDQNL